jgi:hypothetical protein
MQQARLAVRIASWPLTWYWKCGASQLVDWYGASNYAEGS